MQLLPIWNHELRLQPQGLHVPCLHQCILFAEVLVVVVRRSRAEQVVAEVALDVGPAHRREPGVKRKKASDIVTKDSKAHLRKKMDSPCLT